MKSLAFHPAFFALIGLVLLPLAVAHASPPPANNVPFHQVPDFEQWEREHPAAKRLADLDVDEPRTVRMIYFLPKNRQAQPDIDAKLNTLIRDVQQYYAEQMENHGFARKTFSIETDVTGKAVVHHVNGRSAEFYDFNTVRSELCPSRAEWWWCRRCVQQWERRDGTLRHRRFCCPSTGTKCSPMAPLPGPKKGGLGRKNQTRQGYEAYGGGRRPGCAFGRRTCLGVAARGDLD